MKTAMLAIVLCAITLVSGCASVAAANQKIATDIQNVVEPIKQTTLADAQAALKIAKARGDTDAAICFQDIVNDLSAQDTTTIIPPIVGVLSGLEAARTFQPMSIPPRTHRDCAVLVVDAQKVALSLGLSLGVPAAELKAGAKLKAGAATLKAAEAQITH